jgi:hypothetical protein
MGNGYNIYSDAAVIKFQATKYQLGAFTMPGGTDF